MISTTEDEEKLKHMIDYFYKLVPKELHSYFDYEKTNKSYKESVFSKKINFKNNHSKPKKSLFAKRYNFEEK